MKDGETRKCSVDGKIVSTWKKAAMHILREHRILIMGVKVSEIGSVVDSIFPPFSG